MLCEYASVLLTSFRILYDTGMAEPSTCDAVDDDDDGKMVINTHTKTQSTQSITARLCLFVNVCAASYYEGWSSQPSNNCIKCSRRFEMDVRLCVGEIII